MGAYVCYRPDLGYVQVAESVAKHKYENIYGHLFTLAMIVQGMSFIAAILLLNLDEADAFVVFANLVNRPLLAAFYRVSTML